MRFVGKSENGKKRSSDGSESRLLAKIKMAFTERSRNNFSSRNPFIGSKLAAITARHAHDRTKCRKHSQEIEGLSHLDFRR